MYFAEFDITSMLEMVFVADQIKIVEMSCTCNKMKGSYVEQYFESQFGVCLIS